MVKLLTFRLKLAPISLHEAPVIAPLITEKISRWTSLIPWPYGLKDAEKWIAHSPPEKRLGIYLGNKMIGAISMPVADGEEVGFWINGEFEKLGYATEAAAAVIAHTFSRNSVQFILSAVHRDNLPSRRVHEKLGYMATEETERFWPNKNAKVPVLLYKLSKLE